MDERLRKVLLSHFDEPEGGFMETTTFAALGADSLAMLDMLLSLEVEYKIEIPDDVVFKGKIATLGDLQSYLYERTCV